MIVIIYKRYKREDAVDTTIQVEKNQNMPEAEVRRPNKRLKAKGPNMLSKSFQRMIEETSQL